MPIGSPPGPAVTPRVAAKLALQFLHDGTGTHSAAQEPRRPARRAGARADRPESDSLGRRTANFNAAGPGDGQAESAGESDSGKIMIASLPSQTHWQS